MRYKSVDDFLAYVKSRDPNQPEFLQAVKEVMTSLWPFIEKNPKYAEQGLLERLIEPERAIQFRVPWMDDKGQVQVNRAFRVQFNSAIGPYKGGMRFHPSVNLSILKFLGFEQTFKNALTTLPMGGGKGGSDFDPRGKSNGEIMRFCQSLMLELYRHIGSDTDVPAGDIGVGGREVGYMTGMMKKLSNDASCVFTGKGTSFGGSLIRPEATGYGLVYFVEDMLKTRKESFKGKRVAISGFGNVAWGAALKATELGAKVVTLSGPDGYILDEDGLNKEKIAFMGEMLLKDSNSVAQFAKKFKSAKFIAGKRPWEVKVDVALACAIQNELDEKDAKTLVKNGCICVGEGANMPSTLEAVEVFHKAKLLFSPGKASNAGGVATSGLEMTQNAQRMSWTSEEVDAALKKIMHSIHENCVAYGKEKDGYVNYVNGANIAGFVKVADAMLGQGVV